jgi:hypothetical protein
MLSKLYSTGLFVVLLLIMTIACVLFWIVSEKDLKTRLLEALENRFSDAEVRDENLFTLDPESHMGVYMSPLESIEAVKNFLTEFFSGLGYECCAVPNTHTNSNPNRFLVKKDENTLHVALNPVSHNHIEEYHIHITPFSYEP